MRPTTCLSVGAIATITLAATACLAGHWEFEQVDSGSLGSYVAIDKTSDGTIWLAYVNRDSAIRLAHRDSVWEYEDMDTAIVRPDFESRPPFSFDIGVGDLIGVVGLGQLAQFNDSGWSSKVLPMPMTDVAFSYDLNGRPSLTFKDSLWHGCLGLKTDSSWDTNVVYVIEGGGMSWFSLTRPCWRQGDDCACIVGAWWGDLIQEYRVWFLKRDSGIWTAYGLAGGLDGGGVGFAALVDTADSIHTFWSASDPYGKSELVCDNLILDGSTPWAGACLDYADRVQCVWGKGGKLKFALVPEPTIEVSDISGLGWCDITTDTLSQPVIAYCLDDGSIYVAHGIDVAGVGGEPQGVEIHLRESAATIVTGVLFLPRDMGAGHDPNVRHSGSCPKPSLLDISGRKVLDLQPGANDIGRIASGVYFVKEPGRGSRYEGRVRKVVIQR